MKNLALLSVVALLSACGEQKKEPAPSVEQLVISTPTSPVESDDRRIIHRKRFQEKPVTLHREKPFLNPDGSATNLVNFWESTEVKCVDVLTLSDGSTRHVGCGQWEQITGTKNTKTGFSSFSTSRANSSGYFSYMGVGVSLSQVIHTFGQKNPPR